MTEKLHISYNITNSTQNSKKSLCRVFRHLRNGFHFHQSEARHVSLVQMGYYCSRSCGCLVSEEPVATEDSVPSTWAAWLMEHSTGRFHIPSCPWAPVSAVCSKPGGEVDVIQRLPIVCMITRVYVCLRYYTAAQFCSFLCFIRLWRPTNREVIAFVSGDSQLRA